MEDSCKQRHRGRLDLVSFFMFEASGDSEGDFSDDLNVECSRYRDRYGCHGKSPIGGEDDDDDNDDAESCVLGLSRSSSDYNLHDMEDRNEEIVAAEMARHDRKLARDLQATVVIARRRDDHKEISCVSDDSITNESDDHYLRDREKPPCLSDDSIGISHLHHQHHHYRNKFLTEEEKGKLFWEACLAS